MTERSIYCTLCEKYLRPERFNPKNLNARKRAPDGGPSGRCTRCLSGRRLALRCTEPPPPIEKRREWARRWYSKMMNDPERHAAHTAKERARYAADLEANRAKLRAYKAAHKERFRELYERNKAQHSARRIAWAKRNPERERVIRKRYELRRVLRRHLAVVYGGGK